MGLRIAIAAGMLVGSMGCTESDSSIDLAVSGEVTTFQANPSAEGEPLEGVEVCYNDTCDTTNAEGQYEVFVPAESDVALTYDKEGYGPVLVALTTEEQFVTVNASMLDDATLQAFAAVLETPYPPEGTGFIAITVYSGPPTDGITIPGVSFALADGEGSVYYLDDMGFPSASLTETQTPGIGGFFAVTPADVNVELSGAVGCDGITTWADFANGLFTLPVRDGFLTQAVIICE